MQKITMKTPLVEMDGDEDTDPVADDQRGTVAAVCGSEYRIL